MGGGDCPVCLGDHQPLECLLLYYDAHAKLSSLTGTIPLSCLPLLPGFRFFPQAREDRNSPPSHSSRSSPPLNSFTSTFNYYGPT